MTIGVAVVSEWGEVDAAAAVDALYRAEARSLIGMLAAYVGDVALAEDIAQEAFARVQRTWDKLREPDRAVSYLRAIAFNLARSALRRRRPFAPMPDLASDATNDRRILLDEDERAVVAAVQRLPRQQRACVILRYYSELGIDDIAATLAISPNSVKTHLARGLDALERLLKGHRD
jgi:RNA polymerase sigma factor (sigma-70 family)